MEIDRLAKGLAVAVALVLPAGCATLGGTQGNTVNASDGFYVAPHGQGVPKDIREILSAGGLDVSDPSAPTQETQVAELASGSRQSASMATAAAKRAELAVRTPVLALAAPAPAARLPQVTTESGPKAEAEAPPMRLPDVGPVQVAAPQPAQKRERVAVRPRNVPTVAAPQVAEAKGPRRF